MKAVLLSIRPNWCEKIFIDEVKTIEVRKDFPQNIKLPFKVFVYETLGKHKSCGRYMDTHCPIRSLNGCYEGGGAIIGSFVCDKVEEIEYRAEDMSVLAKRWAFNRIAKQACLTAEQLKEYLNGKKGYGWHITSPKAFEFYRDIKEFAVYGRCAQECSEYDICMKYDSEETRVECPDFAKVPLKRAPQSWCYVEEI